jgi:hypothetical protein
VRIRRSGRANDREAAFRAREAEARAARETGPSAAAHDPAPRPSAPRETGSAVSAQRLDELRAQARFARERYDLYKARTYGPRLTSPSRLGELERENARAQTSLSFAESEARAADQAGAQGAGS